MMYVTQQKTGIIESTGSIVYKEEGTYNTDTASKCITPSLPHPTMCSLCQCSVVCSGNKRKNTAFSIM